MNQVITKINSMREDRQTLMLMHLSQLLTYITGFGGLIAPIVIWATTKDRIYDMDRQGKEIINFQLSMIIYAILSIPLILALGLGILTLIAVAVISFIYPIINAVRANNGEPVHYPFTIDFLN